MDWMISVMGTAEPAPVAGRLQAMNTTAAGTAQAAQ